MFVSRYLKMALILGLLSAIGPFAIDMYLPALPAIGQSLGADVGAVQFSLTAFFLSLGVGQLLYGPVSDMVGRKPPLYFGLGLFTVASVGCALASDIETLVALRFLQGLGAAAGMAIPRAVVRDLHTGTDAARLMSLLILVFSVSPILAPLAGSGVIALTGWRGVFWVVAVAAVAGLALVYGSLQETRPASDRVESSLGGALRAYALLLRDWHYLGLVFIGGCAMAGFFVYLAGSPFVLINHYGLTPTQYSLAFGVNAAAFIGASQFTATLGEAMLREDTDMLREADPVMRAMFLWHGVEEVEHKAVAYDLYQTVAGGGYMMRVSALVTAMLIMHVVVAPVFINMLRLDGVLTKPGVVARGLNRLYGRRGVVTCMMPEFLAWFRPGFHPWETGMPEKVAAWLEEYGEHGDPMRASAAVYGDLAVKEVV